jgi:hypothetical protein
MATTTARRTVAKKGTQSTNGELNIIPASQWLKDNLIVGMDAAVSINTNGYPFMGFTNKAGVRENIYFSVKTAKYFSEEDVFDTAEAQLDFLRSISFADTTNAQGEKRTKMFMAKETISIVDILAQL